MNLADGRDSFVNRPADSDVSSNGIIEARVEAEKSERDRKINAILERFTSDLSDKTDVPSKNFSERLFSILQTLPEEEQCKLLFERNSQGNCPSDFISFKELSPNHRAHLIWLLITQTSDAESNLEEKLFRDMELSTHYKKLKIDLRSDSSNEMKLEAIIHSQLPLSDEERMTLLANLIDKEKIPLSEVSLSSEQMFSLAKQLSYIDLRNFKDVDLGKAIIENCSKPYQLFINNDEMIKELTALPLCKELNCSYCVLLQALPDLPICKELDCSYCRALQALPALPLCEKLNCKECDTLKALSALPLCEKLNCSCCRVLQALPDLPRCKELDCCECAALQALPALPLCEKLNCKECNTLKALPDLPRCEKLNCSRCRVLQALPDLPRCEKLICFLCEGLQSLPALPRCEKLDCCECAALKALPALPLCKELNCSRCNVLRELPALPRCEKLDCSYCVLLQALPDLPICKELNCSRCNVLRELPALPLCKELNCSRCNVIQALPALPLCEKLDCSECAALQTLPALPSCLSLNCESCTALQEIPELPFGAIVYSPNAGRASTYNRLEVDLTQLLINPCHVLNQLGKLLLQNNPFPSIDYYENGEKNIAIDVGGVRRDLVSRLFDILFKNSQDALANHLKWDENENYPLMHDAQDSREQIAYRTIGRVMAECYADRSSLKIGSKFPMSLYDRIVELKDTTNQDAASLTLYLGLRGLNWLAPLLLEKPVETPTLSSIQKGYLLGLLENLEFEQVQSEQDLAALIESGSLFQEPLLALLVSKIVKNAQADPRILPILLMANELNNGLGKNSWKSLADAGSAELQKRIEGVLDKVNIISHLDYESQGFEYTGPIRTFVETWINDADEKALSDFVRAVTGLNGLGENQRLKMNIVDRGEEYIPVAHTCFFTLDIPESYPTQEVFNSKIKIFLTYAREFSIS